MKMVVMSRVVSSRRRVNAGSKVGGASLCRSMPSNTRMNFFPLPLRSCWDDEKDGCRSRWRCTTNALSVSHRPPDDDDDGDRVASSSSTAEIVRSNRCRAVIHSWHLIMTYEILMVCRMAFTMELLPVASTPWTTSAAGLGMVGWRGC